VAEVIAGGNTAALGSPARIAEQPNDAITKATGKVRASNATVTPHIIPYYLPKAR
jgi:hypothetical protein